MSTTNVSIIADQAAAEAKRNKRITFGVIIGLIAYIIFSVIQFEIASIPQKWSSERAALFILDTYAYKDHVEFTWEQPDEIEISFEGGFRAIYQEPPAWYAVGTQFDTVQFEGDQTMRVYRDRIELHGGWPDLTQPIVFGRDASGSPAVLSSGPIPDWVRVTENKVEVRPSLFERLQVYARKAEIHRYEMGWGYFWFDFDSPLVGTGPIEAIQLMFSSDRVFADRSNAALVVHEFLNNDMWFHKEVFWALAETFLMAVLGTFFAAFVGLPLAFLAAKNVASNQSLRFVLRRLFDMLRGIDMLIWSLIFLRAFGPGIFTGIFAIAFTDTGSLGKLMSEAIENTDEKQGDGIRSTGAKKILRHRFGVVPQILPVFVSQGLYHLESNTRSAVIIGAMGAGGIGLQFLGALQTGSDFENVAYMAILILLMVIAIDQYSSWLRRKLIGLS